MLRGLAGVEGGWRALVSPHVLWFRHVNQAGLRLFWAVKAGVRL